VRVWRVTGQNGQPVGTFLADYFARTSKRSGAWMSALRTQHRLDGDVRPVIVNVMNFARAPKGQPTLLSFDDARTLFHEFGHALGLRHSNDAYGVSDQGFYEPIEHDDPDASIMVSGNDIWQSPGLTAGDKLVVNGAY